MKYEFKILYSPIKWISCLILVILIPLVMYVPTYFDFVNVSSIYMPFVGIVLFSDILFSQHFGNNLYDLPDTVLPFFPC